MRDWLIALITGICQLAAYCTAICAANFAFLPLYCRAQELYGTPPADIDVRIENLVKSYPEWILGREGDVLVLKGGKKFQISDGIRTKTFDELLEKPDIDDMFYVPYPKGPEPAQPARNSDPGRVRYEPLFVTMYGDCKLNEVSRNLRIIEWLPKRGGGKVSITKINGIDLALESVSKDLDELPLGFTKYLKPTSGTYNCRAVAGSIVRSMHAYAASIDLNASYANYWRWTSLSTEPKWQNQIPLQIVRVFEKHGFIWGGYWYHYDTMHFEYRPELLADVPGSRR